MVDVDLLKTNPTSEVLQKLRIDLINQVDYKLYQTINWKLVSNSVINCDKNSVFIYFNQGILEILLPQLSDPETPTQHLLDMLAIVNSYFFTTSDDIMDCFRIHSQVFTAIRTLLIRPALPHQLIDMTLRVVRNELATGLTKSAQVYEETPGLMDVLAGYMGGSQRGMLVAEIAATLCKGEQRFSMSMGGAQIVQYISSVIGDQERAEKLTDKGLVVYLSLLFHALIGNEAHKKMVIPISSRLMQYARHYISPQVKLLAANILVLVEQSNEECRYIMMQSVQGLPTTIREGEMIMLTCNLVEKLCMGNKQMQRQAGELQALEKIGYLLQSLKYFDI